jgi:hypothetical protein
MVSPLFGNKFCVAAIFAVVLSGVDARAAGAVGLDNRTFDRMIAIPGVNFLVKLDKSYAYGEDEDAFAQLCRLAHPVKNFLIGEIAVQEYGDKENADMQDRFGVKSEEFPAYFLFTGSAENPVRFTGFPNPSASKPDDWNAEEDGEWEAPMLEKKTAENLVLWLKVNGVRVPLPGTILEFDELVSRFLRNGNQESDILQARKMAEEEFRGEKLALVYVRVMEKVKAKGVEYIKAELARVQKLMTRQITPEKKQELSDKVMVLSSFAQASS